MRQIQQSFDLVVAGGGLAGFCAAIAAARQGLKTCLVHERPVLGGVASSEMRVTVHGAACHHPYGRETGIIAEALAEERARNHEVINENGWTNSVFDQVLYDLAVSEPNLTLHLNTPVTGVVMDGGSAVEVPATTAHGWYERPACATSRRIAALTARTLSAETELTLRAPLFVDATGDAFVADLAGCGWRMGSEGRDETGETHAAAKASTDTMGNSIHIRARDMGRDCPFAAPAWAVKHENPDFFYKQGRTPHDPRGGYWWIEIGVPWHTIHDNETIRHQLTRHALGVWDWMKNRDPVMKEKCRTYALDFVGQVPGKRESRRVYGRHWLDENQLQANTAFPDEICHGGWFIDLHTPGGLLAPTSEPLAAHGYQQDCEYAAKSYVGPYGVPLRSLMARDVDNLFLAGRCISTTRAALGTVRVMGTTALMGQAVGTAAAVMRARGLDLPALADDAARGGAAVQAVQQRLLRDGVFLPHIGNRDEADLARRARASASSSAVLAGHGPGAVLPWSANPWHGRAGSLEQRMGQNVWCGNGRIDRLALGLDNASAAPVRLPVRLVRVDHIWDYRQGGSAIIAETVLTVPPGNGHWVGWEVAAKGLATGWLRIEAGPAAGVAWMHSSGVMPGHVSYRYLSPTRYRGNHCGFAFQIEPAQPVCGPEQALTGVTRPHTAPNQWRSDPGLGLPAWFELAWDAPQTINRVELTFPGQILREVHADAPFAVEAQVARDYLLVGERADGTQVELARIAGNRAWRRAHDLAAPATMRRLRLVVTATNGDPAAGLSEIRCYGPSKG